MDWTNDEDLKILMFSQLIRSRNYVNATRAPTTSKNLNETISIKNRLDKEINTDVSRISWKETSPQKQATRKY